MLQVNGTELSVTRINCRDHAVKNPRTVYLEKIHFRHTISLIVNDVIQRILLFSVSSESSFTHLSNPGLKHTLETDSRRKRFVASKSFVSGFLKLLFSGVRSFSRFIPTVAKGKFPLKKMRFILTKGRHFTLPS